MRGNRPALKGNLALKSSPLNPSSGKAVSQDLVIDHMNAHYRKLLNAKSAIDSSVPKAYMSSQKVRDRQTRDNILGADKKSGSMRRPMSARSMTSRPNSARNGTAQLSSARGADVRRSYNPRPEYIEPFQLDDVDYGDATQDEINCINALVNDTIDSERLDRVLNGASQPPGGRMSVRSGSGSGGQRTSRGMTQALNMNTAQRKTMSADILDKRNHAFSEPGGSFTPRVLRNPKYKDVPSKLSQTKHFRPAKTRAAPPVSPSQKRYAQSASESDILDETLMSRDFSTRMTMSGAVPRLDISIDQDHMKWLQEQSARHESKSYRPLDEELALQSQLNRSARAGGGHTRQKIQREDEELSYLDFITGVTNDVLTRGIFTNRVLCNVFEEHVQKNKNRLDEDRMRGMLGDLREDLGIPAHESYRESPDDVGMGSSRPPVRSKTKSTGYTGDFSQFKNVRVGSLSQEVDHSLGYADVRRSADVRKSADEPYQTGGKLGESNMMSPSTFTSGQSAVNGDQQGLTDIVEVSEKSPSVSSLQSKTSSRVGAAGRQGKKMDDALVNLLGLDDTTDAYAVTHSNVNNNAAPDVLSVKSTLSSHTSDKPPKVVDPLDVYAATLSQLDQSDKASIKSTSSKASKTSTLKGEEPITRPRPKPLPRQSTTESLYKSDLSRQTSVDSAPRDVFADEPLKPRLSRQASTESTSKSVGLRHTPTDEPPKPRLSRQASTESASKSIGSRHDEQPKPLSRQESAESASKSLTADDTLTSLPPPATKAFDEGDAVAAKSKRRDLAEEDEVEDLESNVDFGKTTLFGKTRNLGLTYKALSQASDEEEQYSDHFSDDDF